MKFYNLLRPKEGKANFNFNLLPYISFFWGTVGKKHPQKYLFLNVGWLHLCCQFTLRDVITYGTYSNKYAIREE